MSLLIFSASVAEGSGGVSPSFSFQGRFLDASGTGPLTGAADIKFEILSQDKGCVLYAEKQSVDLGASGMLAAQVGSAVGSGKRAAAGNDSGNSMATVFANSGSIPGVGGGCPYSPAAGHIRYLRVTVTPQAGSPVTLDPDQVIGSVPQAVVAEAAHLLQGKSPTEFVQVTGNGSTAYSLSKTGLDKIFAGGDAQGLHHHNSEYMKLGDSFSSVTISGTPVNATDACNKGYADGKFGGSTLDLSSLADGKSIKWDAATSKWVAYTPSSSSGTVTNVTGSGPITVSNGSTTPQVGISQASGTTDGYLSSAHWSLFNSKEPAITAGTSSQYLRGDKTLGSFNADARAVLSAGTGISYSAITGTISADVGTSANKLVQLDASGKLPAVDGSQLTGVTVGTVANSATTATSANTANAIVARDPSGNFSAGTITASAFSGPLTGNVTGNVKVTTTTATCDASIEGMLRYNSDTKKMQFCNGTIWGNVSSGTIAAVSIGAPSSSLVKSGPVDFLVTYGSATDSSTITLNSGHVSFGGTATAGCSVTSVSGSGFTRTVTVNGCTGTGTVNISIAAGTANSTTGDAAGVAGPSISYQVDNTGPSAPTGVTLGAVPANFTNSPTITYSAATDSGGSTVANHQVKIIKTSDSTLITDWVNHTSGSDVGGLSMEGDSQYSVFVRAVDALGNIGAQTSAVNWSNAVDLCAGTPAIGTGCAGGALYAGQFDGGKYMVTPSGCTNSSNPTCAGGTDTVTKVWNNATATYVDLPGVENVAVAAAVSTQRGSVNTAAIVAYYPSANNAAKYCDDLVYGGYDDWFLPNKSELAYLYCHSQPTGTHNTSYPQEDPNCTNYGGKTSELTGFVAGYYWSSTEYNDSYGRVQNFMTGFQNGHLKDNGADYVRCMRRY